jgi:hypothetical protein
LENFLNTSTVLRHDILVRLRDGDRAALREMVAATDRGVRLLLSRHLDASEVPDAVAEIHRRVLLAIGDGRITASEELPGLVRTVVGLYLAMANKRMPAPVDPAAIKNLRLAMNSEELEILHRYYVLGETAEQIGETMGISVEAIQAVRRYARRVHRKPAAVEYAQSAAVLCA